jgi:hypothetical protein
MKDFYEKGSSDPLGTGFCVGHRDSAPDTHS